MNEFIKMMADSEAYCLEEAHLYEEGGHKYVAMLCYRDAAEWLACRERSGVEESEKKQWKQLSNS